MEANSILEDRMEDSFGSTDLVALDSWLGVYAQNRRIGVMNRQSKGAGSIGAPPRHVPSITTYGTAEISQGGTPMDDLSLLAKIERAKALAMDHIYMDDGDGFCKDCGEYLETCLYHRQFQALLDVAKVVQSGFEKEHTDDCLGRRSPCRCGSKKRIRVFIAALQEALDALGKVLP
jgi:hypothetical protein